MYFSQIILVPGPISMAAFSGGMLTGVKVTPLLTIEEAITGRENGIERFYFPSILNC
ncbi:MAG: hypothetical protein CM1200mP37_6990 [Chloroflexota bacterium]|nr:MAG: hypothetical protein CM1200mP37_6990 [Chloroflexota bacterium]